MREISNWLIGLEHMAENLYREAATRFKGNAEFSHFLEHLTEDEAWHIKVMGNASEYLRQADGKFQPVIALDADMKKQIEAPVKKGQEMLSKGEIEIDDMIDLMVKIEFSEWNDLFVYIVDSLKKVSREFQYMAAKIQAHRHEIENFIERYPGKKRHAEALKKLRPIWEERILFVDDDEAILNLLKALFSKDAEIETAVNGKVALGKTKTEFFDVIVSDIDMPVMNGVEFFKEAVQHDPSIRQRFVFFSGALSAENLSYLNNEQVPCLSKPVYIEEIRSAVLKVLRRESKVH